MKSRTAISGACALLLGLGATSTSAFAAGEDTGGTEQALVATASPVGPTCPSVKWHIIRDNAEGPGNYKGVVWFSDMSGASILTGTMSKSGVMKATVKSVAGKGPSGVVSGTRTSQGVHARLVGPGCSKVAVDVNYYRLDQGGGRG
jgi:hypothetical protein